MGIVLTGMGSKLPSKRLSNVDLSKMVDTSDEWIRTRTGIEYRYVCEENEGLSMLATEAAKKALKMSATVAKDIDLIICATSTPDKNFPSCACEVQAALGNTNALCFDISAACSGFIYALHTADSMMLSKRYKKTLLIGADVLSRHIDWEDRTTCVLFGDGAAAAVLEFDEAADGILGEDLGSDGSRGDSLSCNALGENPYMYMNGQEVFKFAVRTVPESIKNALEDAGIKKEEVKFYVLHQANVRILDSVAKKLEEDLDKFPKNLDKLGNTSGASVPLLLDDIIRDGSLKKGDIIVISGFGAGLTWGSMVMRY